MVSLSNYVGREQAYVKHVFLESYLEALIHKTASVYPHIVYVDGFAGPWQSTSEKFEDTSFGIGLNALRKAKASWKSSRPNLQMSAYLVEKTNTAYNQLSTVPERFPDLAVKTYQGGFVETLPHILSDIPSDAFTFFLIDPKGWRVPLKLLSPLLQRPKSEVIFNFMFDFINRAASISEPTIQVGLDELMHSSAWRDKLIGPDGSNPQRRKEILCEAFGQSLKKLGGFEYVAETTVLKTTRDRPLYCLFYATHHKKGIEVFRDCQVRALREQAKVRAAKKVHQSIAWSGQDELFKSMDEMSPDDLGPFLEKELSNAENYMLANIPVSPDFVRFDTLCAKVMEKNIVRLPELN